MMGCTFTFDAMFEDQLTALLAKIKDDAGLQEKLKGASSLDAAVALMKEAGFEVSKADLLKYQANHALELSDQDLEKVAGGQAGNVGEAIWSGFWLFLGCKPW